ncbi:MAG: galactose-1-epimerase [Rhodoferax sp.]|nr:galactose-1-epimerase [Rhodoferax sp.]
MTTANPTSVHSTPGPRLPQVFGLANGGTHIMVTDRGASWLSCELDMGPDSRREILLGHQEPFMYGSQPGYLGAIVGRYANRIAGSRFVDATGQTHVLTPNEGEVQLHGGLDGFDKRDWQVLSRGPSRLVLGLESPAGDQGFPGNLQAQVTYEVALDGAVTIRFDTRVDAVCPVNLSSHGYFNLDGADAQSDFGDVLDHTLWIASKHYLPIDARLIPTGELAPVQGTPFDFSTAQRLRGALAQNHPQLSLGGGGLDHCFMLDTAGQAGARPVAKLCAGDGSLTMTLTTSYPGLQCYSGNYLTGLPGRNGRPLTRHAGLALEPEYFPDSPNHPEWPQASCWQQPGELRSHYMCFAFDKSP